MCSARKENNFMRIDIQARGFDLSEDLREHTERRLQFALNWANYDVRTVTVGLSDVNGPRGGNDKRCRIQVSLVGAQDVVIEDSESDLYFAIDRAADRTERTVTRRLGRLREQRHGRVSTEVTTDVKLVLDTGSVPNSQAVSKATILQRERNHEKSTTPG
jgi:ribosomal subunit interface protein